MEKPTLNIILTDMQEPALRSVGFYDGLDKNTMKSYDFRKHIEALTGGSLGNKPYVIMSMGKRDLIAHEMEGRPEVWEKTEEFDINYLTDILSSMVNPKSISGVQNVNTVVINGITRQDLESEIPYLNQHLDINYL